jgi:hypothetical protein
MAVPFQAMAGKSEGLLALGCIEQGMEPLREFPEPVPQQAFVPKTEKGPTVFSACQGIEPMPGGRQNVGRIEERADILHGGGRDVSPLRFRLGHESNHEFTSSLREPPPILEWGGFILLRRLYPFFSSKSKYFLLFD